MADPNALRAIAQALMQQQGGPQYRAPVPGAYGPMGAGMDSTAAEYNPPLDEIPGLMRGDGMSEDEEELGMQELADQAPGLLDQGQPGQRPGAFAPMGAGMSEDAEELGMQELADEEDWTDMGMQNRFVVDPYGNPLPGTPQFPIKPGRR